MTPEQTIPLARNIKRVGHLDIPGGGQVVVDGHHAFIGHMAPPHGTSIVDVSDPKNPKLTASIELADGYSHSHKVRVAGDLMYTNVEQYNRHFLRLGDMPSGFKTDRTRAFLEHIRSRQANVKHPRSGYIMKLIMLKKAVIQLRRTIIDITPGGQNMRFSRMAFRWDIFPITAFLEFFTASTKTQIITA